MLSAGIDQNAERGRLLYQEEWSKTKRFKDTHNVVIGLMLMGMSFVLAGVIGSLLVFGGSSDPVMAALMGFMLVGMLFFMSFAMLSAELKRVPFKIHERGFTLPNVPLAKGWRRQDEFIPWSRVDTVQLEEQVFMSINVKKIKLGYDGTKSLDLAMGLVEEPFAVMKALNLVVPSKMDEKFKAYLGDEQERKVIKYPLPEGSGRDWMWLMPVFLQLIITVMIGTAAWSMLSSGRWITMAVFGTLLLIMSLVFFWMLLTTDSQAQTERIRKKAVATMAGVMVPATAVGRLARHTRPVVPYSEIRAIRTALEPLFFSHQAEFETFGGEKFRVPYQVYEYASRLKQYTYDYFEYINKGPALAAEKVMPRNWPGTLLLFILFCSPVLIAPLIQVDLSGSMELVQSLMLLVVMSVLLPLLSVARNVISKRQKLGDGLVATKEGITISDAPAKFRNIPQSELVSTRIARDMWTLHCEILTVKGRLKVGYSAAEKLLMAGYAVEGAENITPLAKLAPEKPEGPGVEAKKPGHARLEPGKLIAEQDPESLRTFQRKFYKWGIPLTIVGVALLALPFYLPVDTFLLVNLMVLVLLPLLLGPIFIVAARKMRPARIHENGLIFADGNRKEGVIFVPYGRIKGYADFDTPLTGSSVRLQIEGGFYNLPKSFPGFNVLFEEMKKKFGKPEYDSSDFQQFTERTFRVLELILLVFALAFGYVSAVAFNVVNGFLLPLSLLGKTLVFGTPLLLLFLAYALHYLENGKHKFPGKADLRKAGALIAAALVLFAAGWAINIPDPQRTTIYAAEVPESWAQFNATVEGQTLEVRNNISVQPGEHLVISNSTVTFPLSSVKEFRIYVSRGGSLEVSNSLIRSNSSEFGLKFSIFGSAHISNSTLTGLYASPWYKNGVGGLEIFSSDVSVVNCSISDNGNNGILVVRSSPLIEGCNISGNGDDGIEMQDASPVIRNCRIAHNDWAVMINPYSSPRLEGNVIEGNNHGVFVDGSSPVIVNNTFADNRGWAIKYLDNGDPHLENNTLVSNEEGVVQDMATESYFSVCAAVVTVVGIVACAAVLARIARKRQAAAAGPESAIVKYP